MSSNIVPHTMHRINSRGVVPRNLTCQVDFGGHMPFIKTADLIEEAFSTRAIRCIMPFGKGRFQVSFTDERHVATAICDGFVYENRVIKMTPIEQRTVTVTLKNCPIEIHPDDIACALLPYGKVLKHEFVIDEKRGWLKGPRRIQMEMKTPVPNFLKIGVYTTMVQYPGVIEMCARCKKEGHLSFECEEDYCHKCKRYEGHRAKDCPRGFNKKQTRKGTNEEEKDLEEDLVQNPTTGEKLPLIDCEGCTSLEKDLQLSDEEIDFDDVQTPKQMSTAMANADTVSPSKEKKSFAETTSIILSTPQRKSGSVPGSPKPDSVLGDFSSVDEKKKQVKKKKKRPKSAAPTVHRQDITRIAVQEVNTDHPCLSEGLKRNEPKEKRDISPIPKDELFK